MDGNKRCSVENNKLKKLIDEKFLLKNKIKEYEKMFEDVVNRFHKNLN